MTYPPTDDPGAPGVAPARPPGGPIFAPVNPPQPAPQPAPAPQFPVPPQPAPQPAPQFPVPPPQQTPPQQQVPAGPRYLPNAPAAPSFPPQGAVPPNPTPLVAFSLGPEQSVDKPRKAAKGGAGGGPRIGRVVVTILGFLMLAAVGAAAVIFLVGGGEAGAARDDVTAIGQKVAALYAAGDGDPLVTYGGGVYTVGPDLLTASVVDPTLAFYPGADDFCVVLTTAADVSYSYKAGTGEMDGSCAPASAQPQGPVTTNTLDPSLQTSAVWFDLPVGACVLDDTGVVSAGTSPSPGPLASPTIVPCTDSHAAEVYAIASIGGDTAPTEAAFQQNTHDLCGGPLFESYVGVPYIDSKLYYSVLYPTDAMWAVGQREMVCLLSDGGTTTGSLKGSGR